jgi:ABC-type amino acid transport substrate-binding protein
MHPLGILFVCFASHVHGSREVARAEGSTRRLGASAATIHLKIGGILAHPFLTYNTSFSGNYGGLLPSMLKHIVIRGQNEGLSITYDMVTVNSTYDGAVAEMAGGEYDLLLADYYISTQRLALIDFSSPWLMTQLTTIKWKGAQGKIAVDIEELARTDGAACVQQGTFTATVTSRTYPSVSRYFCANQAECSALLKAGACEHWVEDSLIAQYIVRSDPSLQLSTATFSRQYMAFPISRALNSTVYRTLTRLVAGAVDDGKMESLVARHWPTVDVKTAYLHNALQNHHLDIVVVVDPPLVIFDEREVGNSRFSGYVIDMINKAHEDLGFAFHLHLPSDADLSATPSRTGSYSQGSVSCIRSCACVVRLTKGGVLFTAHHRPKRRNQRLQHRRYLLVQPLPGVRQTAPQTVSPAYSACSTPARSACSAAACSAAAYSAACAAAACAAAACAAAAGLGTLSRRSGWRLVR